MVNQTNQTPAGLLDQVEKVLEQHRPVGTGTYYLYCDCGRIGFGRACLELKRLPVIARLTAADVNEGLRSAMWNLIYDRLRRLYQEGKLVSP